MKQILISSILLLLLTIGLKAQTTEEDYDAYSEHPVLMPCPTCIVLAHKDRLKLTLTIDSVEFSDKTIKTNFNKTIIIGFESDYLRINDSLYIKVFIARNQEYDKKFYSWDWDYLKKRGTQFFSMGKGYYDEMEYGNTVPAKGNFGRGLGTYGTPGYIIYHYHYRLE